MINFYKLLHFIRYSGLYKNIKYINRILAFQVVEISKTLPCFFGFSLHFSNQMNEFTTLGT